MSSPLASGCQRKRCSCDRTSSQVTTSPLDATIMMSVYGPTSTVSRRKGGFVAGSANGNRCDRVDGMPKERRADEVDRRAVRGSCARSYHSEEPSAGCNDVAETALDDEVRCRDEPPDDSLNERAVER